MQIPDQIIVDELGSLTVHLIPPSLLVSLAWREKVQIHYAWSVWHMNILRQCTIVAKTSSAFLMHCYSRILSGMGIAFWYIGCLSSCHEICNICIMSSVCKSQNMYKTTCIKNWQDTGTLLQVYLLYIQYRIRFLLQNSH